MTIKIAGIDYSLTGPAITVYAGPGAPSYNDCKFYFYSATPKTVAKSKNQFQGKLASDWHHEIERYTDIAQWALDAVQGCEYVFIEDYAYGATGKVFHIAENIGCLKYTLWNWKIPYYTVAPTAVKKFATGKGNAKKEVMAEAFLKETGLSLWEHLGQTKVDASPSADIVDSYYIMKCGYDIMSRTKATDPAQ